MKADMTVYLERKNNLHIESHNGAENRVDIDGQKETAGKGMRPMELLLSSLASCSSMTLISMLEKQGVAVHEFRVEASGQREKKGASTPFSRIHLHYLIKGSVNEGKLAVLVKLAAEKYCSVAATLSSDVAITHEVELL